MNSSTGRSRVLNEGLSQGSVLSPILSMTYIDGLLYKCDESTLVSAYADDLSNHMNGINKEHVTQ